MTTPFRVLAHFATVCALATLSACGGGSSSADDTQIALDAFTLSAGTLTAPASGSTDFSASWSARASGLASTAYYVTAHALPLGSTGAATDQNRFLARTCSAAAACTNPMTLACTYSSTRVLACPVGASLQLPAGSYTIVAKACAYDAQLNTLCSEQRSTLTLQ